MPLFTLALSSQAYATSNDRWFDVELLVFKRNVDIQDLSEQLDEENVYLKQRERLQVLKAKPATPCIQGDACLHEKNPVVIGSQQMQTRGHRLQRLDSSHLKLVEQRERLEKHELFQPLMHVVWRMPVQNKQRALPIHLFAGENYALDLYKKQLNKQISAPATNQQQTNTVAPINTQAQPEKLDVLAALDKQKVLQDLYEIDGNLLIYVERYLFVEGQLVVRTETEKLIPQDPDENALEQTNNESAPVADVTVQTFNQQPVVEHHQAKEKVVTESLFDQSRRLRSEEIHYLDHPLFGIIVQIRKIPESQLPK